MWVTLTESSYKSLTRETRVQASVKRLSPGNRSSLGQGKFLEILRTDRL